ncbi:hypothetical protein I3842_08G090700 [Carya illinoinensis]|uniref:Uncharacterized protein n=1 Tax=Carya illinoinensis TaxID=32201 RepID=A0A922EAL1_CARIL|nr:hypothetical protein I3842_08G090700 [Carya illinoinensis]
MGAQLPVKWQCIDEKGSNLNHYSTHFHPLFFAFPLMLPLCPHKTFGVHHRNALSLHTFLIFPHQFCQLAFPSNAIGRSNSMAAPCLWKTASSHHEQNPHRIGCQVTGPDAASLHQDAPHPPNLVVVRWTHGGICPWQR